MPTRCRTERGRERQSWCQLETLMPSSRSCSRISRHWQGRPCAQQQARGGHWLTRVSLSPITVPPSCPRAGPTAKPNPGFLLGQGASLGEGAPEKDQTDCVQDMGFGDRVRMPGTAIPQTAHAPISRSSGRDKCPGKAPLDRDTACQDDPRVWLSLSNIRVIKDIETLFHLTAVALLGAVGTSWLG